LESALELEGEQEIRELRLAVHGPTAVGLRAPVQVGEVDAPHAVGTGRDGHDAIGDPRQQQVREGEVAEVVGAEVQLEAVGRRRLRHEHDAGIVDEHVDRLAPRIGEPPDGGEVGEIEGSDLDVPADGRRRVPAALFVAHSEDDPRTSRGESR
jgi:hypothetical protein